MSRRRFGGGGGVANSQPLGMTTAFASSSGFTTRPATTHGTAITPGNNTYGTYAQMIAGASLTSDIFGIQLTFHEGATAANARNMIARIGVDEAGGTSYTAVASDLLVSCAGQSNADRCIYYYIPLKIAAGSSIACAASVNNATVGSVRCSAQFFGTGTRTLVAGIDYGTHFEAIGTTPASSTGTAVTPGQAAEGAWTLLGTTTQAAVCFLVGVGVNNATMGSLIYHADLAASTDGGATKDILVEDMYVTSTTAETLGYYSIPTPRSWRSYPAGTQLYARAQCSGTPDAGFNMAAYAIG